MNVTRKIVTTVFMLLMLLVAHNQETCAQELESVMLNAPVLPALNLQDLELEAEESRATKTDKDRWALTEQDRMSDAEMDEELFGNAAEEPGTLNANDDLERSGEENQGPSTDITTAPTKEKQPTRLVAKQSIESYLRNINSVTIDTYTPPTNRPEGVDVPMRLMPPASMPKVMSPITASLRFQTPDIYHQPLYFEDQALERYGVHRCRRQPFESARKFISDGVLLPNEIRKQPPRSCVHRVNPRYNQPSLIPPNR